MDSYIPDPVRDTTSPLLMPIDNFFTIPNKGTCIIGTIDRGILKKGDDLELMGFGQCFKTTAKDIQIFGESVRQVGIASLARNYYPI